MKISTKGLSIIQSLQREQDLRVELRGGLNVLKKQFKGYESEIKILDSYIVEEKISTQFLNKTTRSLFYFDEEKDSMEVMITGHETNSSLAESILEETKLPRYFISIRLRIISGFAHTGVLKGSTLYLSSQEDGKVETIFETGHETVKSYLENYMTFTGKTIEDIAKAIEVLWFHFDSDVTSADGVIKRLTLEEELIDNPV